MYSSTERSFFSSLLEDVSIEKLAKAFETTEVGSPAFQVAVAEINCRQAVAQIKAAETTVEAAKAQKLAARWTVAAVIVAAIAVVVTAIGIWIAAY